MAKVILINTAITRKANAANIETLGIDIDRPIMDRSKRRILGWQIAFQPRLPRASKSPAGGAA